jgi:ribulose 1,5-bisphosphate carboxylase large subunit-like protein
LPVSTRAFARFKPSSIVTRVALAKKVMYAANITGEIDEMIDRLDADRSARWNLRDGQHE